MPILGAELRYYRSQVVNDTSANGGRISSTREASGSSNSFWPNYTSAQLASGGTWWRKGFLRIDNANDETAENVRIGLWKPMPEDDVVYLAEGTQTDTQGDLSNPDLYGAGWLQQSVTAGASQLAITIDQLSGQSVTLFRDGDTLLITDQVTAGGEGNYEFHVVSGTPTKVGDVVTLTLATALANDYSATNTFVCSIIDAGNVSSQVIDVVVTSSAGTFDDTKLSVSNLGSITQEVTITFTSATNFTVTSDSVSLSPNTGSINGVYAPENVAAGADYLSIPVSAWGGTFAENDTVVFVTVPPCVPIWEQRRLPASTASLSLETRTLLFFVES